MSRGYLKIVLFIIHHSSFIIIEMKLSFLFFGNKPDEKWQLCRQMGIDYAIAKLAPELTGEQSIDNYDSFARSKAVFEENGFQLIGLEGDQIDMRRIKLGLEGREYDIEKYGKMLENMGKLGVNLLCYNLWQQVGIARIPICLKGVGQW